MMTEVAFVFRRSVIHVDRDTCLDLTSQNPRATKILVHTSQYSSDFTHLQEIVVDEHPVPSRRGVDDDCRDFAVPAICMTFDMMANLSRPNHN